MIYGCLFVRFFFFNFNYAHVYYTNPMSTTKTLRYNNAKVISLSVIKSRLDTLNSLTICTFFQLD